MAPDAKTILGINGLGRIGKLTLWNHVAQGSFDGIVVNVGRQAGTSLADLAHYIERDSTYGSLARYLHGYRASGPVIRDVDDARGTMTVGETRVRVLREHRNPREIGWGDSGVSLVVDTTGRFTDPTAPADHPEGSLRGHLEAGAERVILSAPFKIKDKSRSMPDDAVTIVMGINECDYDPTVHRIVSGASCTTTCLAHMLKPLFDRIGVDRILTASMATVHAATATQDVLDRMAKPGASDLRKNRSIFNNIILTTTGAAATLALVLPEVRRIGFMAESVRIPTTAGSLVILSVTVQDEDPNRPLRKELIKEIYSDVAKDPRGYLVVSDEQNVSSDIIAYPRAGAVIEAHEIHTRTAEVTVDPRGLEPDGTGGLLSIPVTQAVIYGWYDNEMGGYVHMLGELTCEVASSMARCRT